MLQAQAIDARLPYTQQPKWWVGLSLVILGAIGDFVSFGLAPQTLVAPVGSTTLVANVIFATMFLGQSLQWQDYAGTALVIAGAVIAVVFGSHEETSYTIQELIELWARLEMIIYASLVLSMLGGLYLFISRAEAILARAMIEALEEHASAAQAAVLQQETDIDARMDGIEQGSSRDAAAGSGDISARRPGSGGEDPASSIVKALSRSAKVSKTGGSSSDGIRVAVPPASEPVSRSRPGSAGTDGAPSKAGLQDSRRRRVQMQQQITTREPDQRNNIDHVASSALKPPRPQPGNKGRGDDSDHGSESGSSSTDGSEFNAHGVPSDGKRTDAADRADVHGSMSSSDSESVVPPPGMRRNWSQLTKGSRSSRSSTGRASGASSAAEQLDRMRHASATDIVAEALESPPEEYMYYSRMHPVFYGVMSGTVGGQSVLFAKAVSELLKVTFAGDNQFRFLLTYVQIVALVVCMMLQQHFLAKGLQLFDTLLIVPVFSSTFMFASIIAGGVYYREFDSFSTVSWACFPIGIALVLCGVYILSGRQKQAQQAHEAKLKELEKLHEQQQGAGHGVDSLRGSGSKQGGESKDADEEASSPTVVRNPARGLSPTCKQKQGSGHRVQEWQNASAVVFSPSPVATPTGVGNAEDGDASGMRKLTSDIEMSSIHPSASLQQHARSGLYGADRGDEEQGGGTWTGRLSARSSTGAGDLAQANEQDGADGSEQAGNKAPIHSRVASERLDRRDRGHTVGHIEQSSSMQNARIGASAPGLEPEHYERRATAVAGSSHRGGPGQQTEPRRGSLLRAGWSQRFGREYGTGSMVGMVPGIGSFFGGVDMGRHVDTLDALRRRRRLAELRHGRRGARRVSFSRRRTATAGGALSGDAQFRSVQQVVPAGAIDGGSNARQGTVEEAAGAAEVDGAEGHGVGQLDRMHLGRIVSAPVEGSGAVPDAGGKGLGGDPAVGQRGSNQFSFRGGPSTSIGPGSPVVPVVGSVPAGLARGIGNSSQASSAGSTGNSRSRQFRSGSVMDVFVDVYNTLTVSAQASSAVVDATDDGDDDLIEGAIRGSASAVDLTDDPSVPPTEGGDFASSDLMD